ncbi:alpha-amylase family glycosyl hydrolase [Mycoplasmopsis gallinacea]|uniref:Alpha-amylase n=1 Tax=Mycoplasmopsis gallinacea TaxID=29556 RepID=A0A6H0V2V1_9BACT|nr:alpha-amylase family glycosyl hydrolase [Mycoplasmopsis gallinacea]QIW62019.1 alpha-amylase [Mycoplasmopsis gallinacea]
MKFLNLVKQFLWEWQYKKIVEKQKRNFFANWDNPKYFDKKWNLDYKNIDIKDRSVQNNFKTIGSNVVYQVLVYNFADGNNDGIGDFIGLKNKIPYFVNLKVDQLWLSPIHPSTSYHGYSVIDFCDVAEQLGGMNAFLDFLDEAHKNGIKVYLDMVFNHTSYEHPWFQKALLGDKKYENFYRFTEDFCDEDIKTDTNTHRKRYPNLNQNIFGTNKKFLGRFWAGMPDLNLDNPEVIDQLIAIQKFWVSLGVDGFRYDAYAEYFSSEIETKNNFNESKIFALLRKESEKINPNIFMFGEWLEDGIKALEYSKFNDEKALDTSYDGMHWKEKIDVRISYENLLNLVNKYSQNSSDWMPFLSNHDVMRWLDNYRQKFLKIKENKLLKKKPSASEIDALKIAIFVLLAMPARPILYYGDELGYFGTRTYGDPALREPMIWNNKNEICQIQETKIDSLKSKVLATSALTLPYVEENISKKDSVYELIKFLNELRIKYPFLSLTDSTTLDDPKEYVDCEDYSSVIIRKHKNTILMFVYKNDFSENHIVRKISRKYNFKLIYSYKCINRTWGIEMNKNSMAIFELKRK